MTLPNTTINTHAPRQPLSRLTLYRLKRVRAEHLVAVAEMEDQYNEKVRAILGNDRPATLALRKQETGNWMYWPWMRRGRWPGMLKQSPAPSIANTFDSELTPYPGTPKPWWLTNIGRSLLVRHGYKPTGMER